jgi:hypothetical protein
MRGILATASPLPLWEHGEAGRNTVSETSQMLDVLRDLLPVHEKMGAIVLTASASLGVSLFSGQEI